MFLKKVIIGSKWVNTSIRHYLKKKALHCIVSEGKEVWWFSAQLLYVSVHRELWAFKQSVLPCGENLLRPPSVISKITATQDHNEIINVELLQYELKDRKMLWLMMVVGVGGASYDLDQIHRFMHIRNLVYLFSDKRNTWTHLPITLFSPSCDM